MSRVGKKPIPIPDKVKIDYQDYVIKVQGDKGVLTRSVHADVNITIEDRKITVGLKKNTRINRSLQGLTRSLLANMITGVSKGFERVLEINGIGYRATLNGNCIAFNLGYSNPVNFDLPEGVSATINKNNVIKLTCVDKEKLGQTAASIRSLRPPEPYKGKGIKYAEEHIRKKVGKTGAK